MEYDYAIIGGGISGLYIYHKLLQNSKTKNKKIILLEKNPHLGGRIYTDKVTHNSKNYFFEAGAGRFAQSHKRLNNLIKSLNLEKNKIKIPNKINFIDTKKSNTNYKLQHHTYYLDKIAKKYANKQNQSTLQKITFKKLLKQNFSPKTIKHIIDGYEYKDLFTTNAYEAVNNYYKNFKSKEQFYILTSGMSSIVQELQKKLKKQKANIKTETYVKDIIKVKNQSSNNYVIKAEKDNKKLLIKTKNLILTVTNEVLQKFSILQPIKNSHIKSVKNTPLTRIYSIFDPKNVWFMNTKKTTTTSPVQYVIPINEKQGTIMSSYTDMKNAMMWHKLNQKSPKKLEEKLLKELSKIYNQKIPKPKTNRVYHWPNGVAAWQPKYNTAKIKKEIIKPLKKENIYIAGENYSNYQGWVEGALETSDNMLKVLLKTQKGGKKTKKNHQNKNKEKQRKTKKIPNCCNHNKTAKICKTKKRTFKLPRRFSRKKCLTHPIKGFTMRSSCTPYLDCKN
tara:strand:- start:1470 stop:2984 length:1515 start_codon:yes stop_codon:yes gene_type:complete